MSKNFGKTWWGEHWLRSLDHIDYDNRLPRGASYARNDKVKSVQVKENQITAKVAGSRATPYKVNIIIPPFFEEQIGQLMERIVDRPLIISKLLNRELDPELLTMAEELGLKIFPHQWTDFKMQCSCPDWAVPCKHLAAVIYMVSREIDNNPFLVFEIHKVDLINELKKRGIFVEEQEKAEIPRLADLYKVHKNWNQEFDQELPYQRVDFSLLQHIAEPLIQLLPDSPSFYHNGNFKEIYGNQFALLTKQQATLYEKTLQLAMDEIEGVTAADSQSLFKRQGLVLQMILALKQICNHPTQFLKNGQFDASQSGKIELLFELLDAIIESGEKVLVFTQFREMGDLLERFIAERFGEKPMFYHGGCNVNQRQAMVDRFQNNRADKIFLLSLKAAGTGLNLTAASHVIHYDLWWNPAVENQATDRAYRIGQNKNVMVHRIITKNTFEERIDEMIQKKKHLADMTVATGENWIGKLSNKELREIFK